MIELTEPQVWTMIGVFTALMFGMLTTVSTLFVRVVRGEISGLRGELNGEIGGLRGELKGEIGALRGELKGDIDSLRGELKGDIDGLRGELKGEIDGLRGEMNARFDAVHVKIDGLDRDVQLLMNREFGIDRD